MKLLRTGMICCALILQCVASWAVYGVRISDLSNGPLPPNPIKVWGKVTSESPVKISDGTAEITVIGMTAKLGDYLVVIGNWSSGVLTVSGSAEAYIGPAQIEMIYNPAGSFLMGTPDSYTADHSGDEHPQHSVTLSDNYIGKYEITRGEYQQFMNADGYLTQSYWSTAGWSWKVSSIRTEPVYWAASQDWTYPYDDGIGLLIQTENHPVVGVSYYEAEAFCNWAGGHLPTEAQWERAARWTGSYSNVYPWGDTWGQQKCNNWEDSLYLGCRTAPVGSYKSYPSPSGCQDMAGNVYEWCQDWYKSYPGSSSPFDYTDKYRVLRGGSWDSYDSYSRCAYRGNYYPQNNYYDIGFRLAR